MCHQLRGSFDCATHALLLFLLVISATIAICVLPGCHNQTFTQHNCTVVGWDVINRFCNNDPLYPWSGYLHVVMNGVRVNRVQVVSCGVYRQNALSAARQQYPNGSRVTCFQNKATQRIAIHNEPCLQVLGYICVGIVASIMIFYMLWLSILCATEPPNHQIVHIG